jgi:hypothetical protein
MIGGRFARPVAKQLKRLALDEDKTVQALIGEALDLLFASRGVAPIRDLDRRDAGS